MKITTYIQKNWEKLPKSNFNDKELVIVRQKDNWDHGYGHHWYQGIGVDQDGRVFEAESSGCSCNGSVSYGETSEALTEHWKDINFDSLQVSFSDY